LFQQARRRSDGSAASIKKKRYPILGSWMRPPKFRARRIQQWCSSSTEPVSRGLKEPTRARSAVKYLQRKIIVRFYGIMPIRTDIGLKNGNLGSLAQQQLGLQTIFDGHVAA